MCNLLLSTDGKTTFLKIFFLLALFSARDHFLPSCIVIIAKDIKMETMKVNFKLPFNKLALSMSYTKDLTKINICITSSYYFEHIARVKIFNQ